MLQSRQQLLVDGERRTDVDAGRDHIVAALAHIDVIVGMNGIFRADRSTGEFDRGHVRVVARIEDDHFVADTDGPFEIFVESTRGERRVDYRARSIRVEVDEPPQVRLAAPDTDLVAEARQPVVIRYGASDDYGVQELTLMIKLPNGEHLRRPIVTSTEDIDTEAYVGVLVDRERQCPMFMVSAEGGVDIEEVARTRPEDEGADLFRALVRWYRTYPAMLPAPGQALPGVGSASSGRRRHRALGEPRQTWRSAAGHHDYRTWRHGSGH